jgi:hypothetical protein
MKQLLLLAVIHLLIFHQYEKDKGEALAPKKYNKPQKTDVLPVKQQDYVFTDIANNTNDSLLSLHPESLPSNFVSYAFLSSQARRNK